MTSQLQKVVLLSIEFTGNSVICVENENPHPIYVNEKGNL